MCAITVMSHLTYSNPKRVFKAHETIKEWVPWLTLDSSPTRCPKHHSGSIVEQLPLNGTVMFTCRLSEGEFPGAFCQLSIKQQCELQVASVSPPLPWQAFMINSINEKEMGERERQKERDCTTELRMFISIFSLIR